MKKLIRIPLILILVCCLSCSFTAAGVLAASSNDITLSTRFDVDSSMLFIEGTVDSEKGNIPMTMTFKNADGDFIAADQTVTNSSVDGKIKFSFEGIPFSKSSESGTYEITVYAAYINSEKTESYEYVGPAKRYELIEKVNDAVGRGDKKAIVSICDEYRTAVTGGDDALFSLSSDGKTVFAKQFIAKGKYNIPEGYEDPEDVEMISESLSAISANYKDALCYAEAASLSSEQELEAWLDKYADERQLFADNPETVYDEAALKEYFDRVTGNNGLYERINKEAKAAENFNDLKDGIIKAGVLETLESAKPALLQEIVESNEDLLPVDINAFNKLKTTDKVSVCEDLTSCKFSSAEDFVKQFDSIVEDYRDEEKKSSGNGSGSSKSSSKGGGGGTTSTSINKPIDTKNAEVSSTTGSGFGDLDDCEWAKEAVGYLASKGVVSGKANGVFDPFTPVTRAEFTKMVTLAFDIAPANYDGTFSDVSVNDWFAPYVAAAYKAGVINGMDDGTFAPNALITRQDMAVLLYRAKGMSPYAEEKDVYYDSENISDYAKSAVFALYFNGIALGYGDGTFGPLNNATRAEAAQMIYKMVTFDK